MQSTIMQYVTLNNGIKMPILGFGTYSINDSHTILEAISYRYRLFGTAQMYGNEHKVGTAIREAIDKMGIKREDFFITTKLSNNMNFQEAKKGIETSLKSLNSSYIDLILIHEPYPKAKEMYKAMETYYKEGKLKAIGISNFTLHAFKEFIKTCEIPPAINQCETHIYYQQAALLQTMKPYGTILESWSPFIAGKVSKNKNGFFNDSALEKIAHKYNKSIAQIVLRFFTQQGIVTIPKASKKEHMQENIDIFNFNLTKEEIKTIKTFDKNATQFSWGYQ